MRCLKHRVTFVMNPKVLLQNPTFDASLLMMQTVDVPTGDLKNSGYAADVHQLMSQYITASGDIA